ncbi:hypothetical protein [Algoriphagus sp.]|uniref:hypothetical protein n=1 Tax=Algoriphagus sp. TaxID=1872435 RepID=UPI0026145941|nr:hypothetical protein [Algoriphagus sp.]
MKNSFIFLIFIILSCSKNVDSVEFSAQKVDTLSEIVADRFYDEDFFLPYEKKFSTKTNGFLFVLPSSSCFNCFDYLTNHLAEFISNSDMNKVMVIKSENIKDREIKYALRRIVNIDSVQIFKNTEFDYIKPHEFYPKLGYVKNGNLSCIAVFEQGNDNKVRNYFKFIELMIQ